MAIERSSSGTRVDADEGSPFVDANQDFVDVLCRFLRTIPVYPDGHSRVVAVSERLHQTAEALSSPVVVEVSDQGLLVGGEDRGSLSSGEKGLRDALLATAVVRVVFQPSAPPASYVSFARALQRNARLASNGHLSFADLWMSPIPGIEVFELVFAEDGFRKGDAHPGSDQAAPASVLGGTVGDGSGIGIGEAVAASLETGLDGGVGVAGADAASSEAVVPDAPPVVRRAHTVSRELRELVRDDEALIRSIDELIARLVADGTSARTAGSGADLLEHLIRVLPIEARLDPRKGLKILRRVLDRLLDARTGEVPHGGGVDLPTRFRKLLDQTFPKRVREGDDAPPPPGPEPAASSDSTSFDEILFLDDSILAGLDDEADEAFPELTAESGITDAASMLLHATLEEPEGPRRAALAAKTADALRARPKTAKPSCIVGHLAAALAVPAATRDLARIAFLAAIVDAAGLEVGRGLPSLTADVAAEIFPLCLRAFVSGGGRAGTVARTVGRARVLAEAGALTAPTGPLTGATLDKIAAERSTDVLPFLEALLVAQPGSRPRVVRALRALDVRSLGAVAMRVVNEARFSEQFLRTLCEDGFTGVDSHRLDVEAAASLGQVALNADGEHDLRTRTYATAALGSFPPLLVERPLKTLAARRLMGGAPKELRTMAEDILRRMAAAAADARPVP